MRSRSLTRETLARCGLVLMTLGAAAHAGGDTATDKGFIERHWRRPIAPQGAAPARFPAVEKSLASASCGTCHPAQLADWKSSFHAQAMGPGVAGQLVGMWREDPESARHAFLTDSIEDCAAKVVTLAGTTSSCRAWCVTSCG